MIAHLKIAVNIRKVVTFLTAPEIEWNIASWKATDPSRYDDVRVNVPENHSDADISRIVSLRISRNWQYKDIYRKIINNQHNACILETNYYLSVYNVHPT